MEFICINIMNSDWKDHLGRESKDKLDDPAWMEALLEKYGLSTEGAAEKGLVMELKRLRSIMKDIVQGLFDGNPVEKASIDHLNKYLAKAVHKYHIEQKADEMKLSEVPLERNSDSILGEIALSFAELITKHDLRRLKICRNPDCRWIFFDESKNRNKCWCESKTCGNLMKVRSFRERKKLEG